MSAAIDCLSAVRDIADMARTPGISSNSDDTLSTTARMRVMCEMEEEPEMDVSEMNEAELRMCILYDADVVNRRRALVRWGALRFAQGCVEQAKVTHGVKS